jgi:hypothetical protein
MLGDQDPAFDLEMLASPRPFQQLPLLLSFRDLITDGFFTEFV